jgi:glutamate dehydrogenase (NAD(P)+)
MLHYALKHGHSLAGYEGADRIGNAEMIGIDCDVLIPAALGGVIRMDNVDQIKAPIIIEAANSPIWPDADARLAERGIIVLPDILANAGGVTASYFEWVQNRQHYQWGLNRVRQELDRVLSDSFERVWTLSKDHKTTLRTAAYMVGIGRVGRATVLGGIF